MRTFERHPASLPVEFRANEKQLQVQKLKNISAGGLCLVAEECIPDGSLIHISIPNLKHSFSEKCRVVWCNQVDDRFHIGVMFENEQTARRLCMIEQVCHIEDYRSGIFVNEGRDLSAAEASEEWIEITDDHFLKI